LEVRRHAAEPKNGINAGSPRASAKRKSIAGNGAKPAACLISIAFRARQPHWGAFFLAKI
jgi:hypothetical protein